MPDHGIDFANGHLFCLKSKDDENDIHETFDVFRRMEKYYNSWCVVTHWERRTMESGVFLKTRMKVRDAVFQIQEGLLERASFVLEK